jgi:hypothetical protein
MLWAFERICPSRNLCARNQLSHGLHEDALTLPHWQAGTATAFKNGRILGVAFEGLAGDVYPMVTLVSERVRAYSCVCTSMHPALRESARAQRQFFSPASSSKLCVVCFTRIVPLTSILGKHGCLHSYVSVQCAQFVCKTWSDANA